MQNNKSYDDTNVFLFHSRVGRTLRSIKGFCCSVGMKRTHASADTRREFTCVSSLPWSPSSLSLRSLLRADSYYTLNHCLSFHGVYSAHNPAVRTVIRIALMVFLTGRRSSSIFLYLLWLEWQCLSSLPLYLSWYFYRCEILLVILFVDASSSSLWKKTPFDVLSYFFISYFLGK